MFIEFRKEYALLEVESNFDKSITEMRLVEALTI